MIFIFVAALLLFGPRRLPELGRTLGKGLAEFRRASAELKRSLDAEGLGDDLRKTRETIASVDPRRYLREAVEADEQVGRVARGPAASTGSAASIDSAASTSSAASTGSAPDSDAGDATEPHPTTSAEPASTDP